jgi:TRAP-type C4-dicarboxylate transport system permease small subunit
LDQRLTNHRLQNEGNALYLVLETLAEAMAVIAAISASCIVVLICASVSMRYFTFTPFSFTEELVGLLMTASFFLALPLATLRSEHVRITVFISALATRYQSLAIKFSKLFGMCFCIWLLFLAIPWVEFAIDRNIKTEVGRLLLYPWMLVIPVSITLTTVAFILQKPSDRTNPINPSKHIS